MEDFNKNSKKLIKKLFLCLNNQNEKETLDILDLKNVENLANIKFYDLSYLPYPFMQSKGTPLHIAVRKNMIAVIQKLIMLGADIDAKDEKGNTSLHDAVRYLNNDMVKLLISYNAQLDLKNNSDYTPFMLAIRIENSTPFFNREMEQYRNKRQDIISVLISAGVNTKINGYNIEDYEYLFQSKPYEQYIYHIIKIEIQDYKNKIMKHNNLSNNIINCYMELSNTAIPELAIKEIVNFMDEEHYFHKNTIQKLEDIAKAIFHHKKNFVESVFNQEYDFGKFQNILQANKVQQILDSKEQQEYNRKSFFR